jgi:serine/threonine protein phosphatase PrpC
MTDSILMSRTEIPKIKEDFETYCIYGQSHVGSVRKENQDFLGFEENDEFALLIVLDGMGGHSGGFEASRIACKAMLKHFRHTCLPQKKIDPFQFLHEVIQKGHEAILAFAAKNPQMEGMGTTAVCAFLHNEQCWVGHVGDSRAHIIRDNSLYQLTIDHTCVHQLARTGDISLDYMSNHPMRHILDRSMGSEDSLEVEVRPTPIHLKKGDRILLSSDGFLQYTEDEDITAFVRIEDLSQACQTCIDTALKRGGSDNITIAILEYQKDTGHDEAIEDARTSFHLEVKEAQQRSEAEQTKKNAQRKQDSPSSLRIEYAREGEYDLPPPPQSSNIVQYITFAITMIGIGILLGTLLNP